MTTLLPRSSFGPASLLRGGVVLAGLVLCGCPGNGTRHEDGGVDPDGGTMSPVQLAFHVEGSGSGDWELDSAGVSIARLDIQSDLGSSGDVRITTLGFVSLKPESERLVGDAPPATYSQVAFELSPGGTSATFEITLVRGSGQTVIVRSSHTLTFDVRCDQPASVEPEDMLALTAILNGSAIVGAVDAAAIPMMPGTSILDETNAPALVAALDDAFETGFTLVCELE